MRAEKEERKKEGCIEKLTQLLFLGKRDELYSNQF